jgi:hypothetical protein
MPFEYALPMPALDVKEPKAASGIRFERWLVRRRDFVDVGSPLAVVTFGAERFEVLANGHAMVARLISKPGQAVPLGAPLAMMHADGESIPYGKPYALSRRA